MSYCKLHLENYNGTYRPGSRISGRLECNFDDKTKIRGIKVQLQCIEENSWSDSESDEEVGSSKGTKVKTIILLTGEHTILDIEKWISGSSSEFTKIPKGTYNYPFFLELPDDIPSTFVGPYGSISYKIKGTVVRTGLKFNIQDEMDLIVTAKIDFNKMSRDLQMPKTYSDEKTVCCLCCAGGVVSMDITLPKTAVVIGEVMKLQVRVRNNSRAIVEALKGKLTKVTKYIVNSPHFDYDDDEELVAAFSKRGVGPKKEQTYDLEMKIPESLLVPNFTNCDLFQVKYVLKISCKMPACTLNLITYIEEIMIGHVQCAQVGNTEAKFSSLFDNQKMAVTKPTFKNSLINQKR